MEGHFYKCIKEVEIEIEYIFLNMLFVHLKEKMKCL